MRQKKPATVEVVPGAKKLMDWMNGDPKVTQAELVKRLEAFGVSVSQQAVSSWLCSHAHPYGGMLREALESITGEAVRSVDWRTREERRAWKRAQQPPVAQAPRQAATGTDG